MDSPHVLRELQAVELKNKIRLKIFEHIPEQRIDITVASKDELKNDRFLIDIMSNAIKLL